MTETRAASVDDPLISRERFRNLGLGTGAVTFVGHVLLFPLGSPAFDVAWAVVWGSAALGTVPGILGIDARAGLTGAVAPGLALALRGEIVAFYHGCLHRPSGASVCWDPPPGMFHRIVPPLGLSVGFVLGTTVLGYAVGVAVRRTVGRVRGRRVRTQ